MDFNKEVEIVVGTYEDYVVGYQVETIKTKRKETTGGAAKKLKTTDHADESKPNGTVPPSMQVYLEQSFAVRVHSGSVRCLTGSSDGALMFSAGQDEMMNLFSLKKRKLLQTSEGAVSCCNFVSSSHLICGSDDGNIYIHECRSSGMKLVKTLRGHKSGITAIDSHQSGKVLLSLSRDKTMRTWNLIKGRCAYVTHIGIEAHLVKWARGNDGFLIAANMEIYLYNNLGNLKQKLTLAKRVNSVEFIGNNMFAIATDSGRLDFFHIEKEACKLVMKFEAHESRIKSIRCLRASEDLEDAVEGESSESAGQHHIQIATASSDGSVKLWSISRRRSTLMEPQELASVDVGARLTCMFASERNELT